METSDDITKLVSDSRLRILKGLETRLFFRIDSIDDCWKATQVLLALGYINWPKQERGSCDNMSKE